MADQNEMLEIVTPMMEHVCDHLCRFPLEIERKEDLEEVCANCQMDQYTDLILNQYDKPKFNEVKSMEKESKDLLEKYVKVCNRYAEEKKNNQVNPRVGSLHTFNQSLKLRSEFLKSILKENGYDDNPIYY